MANRKVHSGTLDCSDVPTEQLCAIPSPAMLLKFNQKPSLIPPNNNLQFFNPEKIKEIIKLDATIKEK